MGRTAVIMATAVSPMLLASCSIVDVPVSTASGSGLMPGSSIVLQEDSTGASDLGTRARGALESEMLRAGYRIETDAEFIVEFAVARRPLEVGILLPESDVSQPEAGTWRSRPMDRDTINLCKASIYRLMLVVFRAGDRKIVFRGSSDDDVCGDINDQKLRTMSASLVAQIRQRSL